MVYELRFDFDFMASECWRKQTLQNYLLFNL